MIAKDENKMRGVDFMTDKEQATMLIDVYIDMMCVKRAEDRDKELDEQIRKTKVKLETLGVAVDNLTDG